MDDEKRKKGKLFFFGYQVNQELLMSAAWTTIQQAMAAGDRDSIKEILHVQSHDVGVGDTLQHSSPTAVNDTNKEWQMQTSNRSGAKNGKPRGEHNGAVDSNTSSDTVFVGGIAPATDDRMLADFLQQQFISSFKRTHTNHGLSKLVSERKRKRLGFKR